MNINVVLQFIHFLCLITVCLCYINAKCENDTRKKRSDNCSNQQYKQNITLCQTADLKMVPFADSEKKSITIPFNLIDAVKFKDCFPYYDIFLINETGSATKKCKLHADNSAGKDLSHTFKDVPPGLYEVDIQPCYTEECCANLSIYFKDLNVTSYNLLSYTSEIPTDNSIIIYAVIATAIGFILIISGFYYICSAFKDHNVNETGSDREELVPVKVAVYVLHYYDDFHVNKQKANMLKDYLIQTSLYDSVKTIEGELYKILSDVHKWLNDVLKERNDDGKIQKIILIDSKDEDNEGPIENLIFNNFIALLMDNSIQCLSSYDNLFVAQINGISGNSDKLRNVVRRHRFYIPKHLVELCLSLCSVSESNVSTIRKHLRELFLRHPIRNLN